MGYKRQRLGKLVAALPAAGFFRAVHVVFGGTGAVGGTALLRMLDLYEEMIALHRPPAEEVPVLVATGRTTDDRQYFTRRLFRFEESRHGAAGRPQPIRNGYLTRGGVFVDVEPFDVAVLPQLNRLAEAPPEARGELVRRCLATAGAPPEGDGVAAALRGMVVGTRPFSEFLADYRRRYLADRDDARFRSVLVGIPLPSLIAYHGRGLELAGRYVEGLGAQEIADIKQSFETAIRQDLEGVHERYADEVIIAHTTSVGGMYDESLDGAAAAEPRRSIRLGFSHSARDQRLLEKQRSAERLSHEYAGGRLKVFITAAAIGIDEVRIREDVPVQREVADRLLHAPREIYPGSQQRHGAGAEESRKAGFAVPIRQKVRVFPPLTLDLDEPGGGEVFFRPREKRRTSRDAGELLRPSYALRSGENGIFTAANAEALYRVMRVASASELGTVLARVALYGDDPLAPFFRDNVCYYAETDNSRQVFDFLAQPALRDTQLGGLEPLALQDLGSAKHQAELHTLGLLILLHRLRTLDVDAIPPYVDVERFDPRSFFLTQSRHLTFEDVAGWEVDELAADLAVLVAAESAADLEALRPLRTREQDALFQQKQEARRRVLAEVLRAVWAIPSLGSPIVFERDGRSLVRSGYYVAPLGELLTERDGIVRWLRARHQTTANPCTWEALRDFHLCVGGFVDLRPHALVVTAKSDRADLRGRIHRAADEDHLHRVLADRDRLPAYGFFAMCGLVAVLYRMRAIHALLKEALIELGTLQEFRWQMPRDEHGHIVVLPGAVEALRMVAEGLEKTTGTERLDGVWGYRRPHLPDRRRRILEAPGRRRQPEPATP